MSRVRIKTSASSSSRSFPDSSLRISCNLPSSFVPSSKIAHASPCGFQSSSSGAGVASGSSVGMGVGVAFGSSVGSGVGVASGSSVGSGVGVASGSSVGSDVGVASGSSVGAGVGVASGSSVGSGVASRSASSAVPSACAKRKAFIPLSSGMHAIHAAAASAAILFLFIRIPPDYSALFRSLDDEASVFLDRILKKVLFVCNAHISITYLCLQCRVFPLIY